MLDRDAQRMILEAIWLGKQVSYQTGSRLRRVYGKVHYISNTNRSVSGWGATIISLTDGWCREIPLEELMEEG